MKQISNIWVLHTFLHGIDQVTQPNYVFVQLFVLNGHRLTLSLLLCNLQLAGLIPEPRFLSVCPAILTAQRIRIENN